MSSKHKRDVENKSVTSNTNKKASAKTACLKDTSHEQVSKKTIRSRDETKQLHFTQKSRISNSRGSCKDSNLLATSTSCTKIDVDLNSPGLCSTLSLANEIKAARSSNLPIVKLTHFQKDIKRKALKKTNVPFSDHIFHSLVDLQIHDEAGSTKTSTKSYEFVQNKDKVFHLEDYYKPCFSLEFHNKVPFQKREIEKVEHYDGFEIYERIKSLPNCE